MLEAPNNIPKAVKQYYEKKSHDKFVASDADQSKPLIQGNFNAWQPQPMETLIDLCIRITGRKVPDFIKLLKNEGRCREEVASTAEMDEHELQRHKQAVKEFQLEVLK